MIAGRLGEIFVNESIAERSNGPGGRNSPMNVPTDGGRTAPGRIGLSATAAPVPAEAEPAVVVATALGAVEVEELGSVPPVPVPADVAALEPLTAPPEAPVRPMLVHPAARIPTTTVASKTAGILDDAVNCIPFPLSACNARTSDGAWRTRIIRWPPRGRQPAESDDRRSVSFSAAWSERKYSGDAPAKAIALSAQEIGRPATVAIHPSAGCPKDPPASPKSESSESTVAR